MWGIRFSDCPMRDFESLELVLQKPKMRFVLGREGDCERPRRQTPRAAFAGRMYQLGRESASGEVFSDDAIMGLGTRLARPTRVELVIPEVLTLGPRPHG